MRDRIDRQITSIIRETSVSSGFIPAEDRDRPGRLWDRIQRDGLRAVRARRIRRTCLCVAASMLALFAGSLLMSFLWDASGVQAFKEGLMRDIRVHGDEISIEYRDDSPQEPSASFEPVYIEKATIEDVQALDLFIPVPTALPEGMVFDTADIVYADPSFANVTLVYRGVDDTPMIISYRYGKRDITMTIDCDTMETHEWDGVEVTHFTDQDSSMDAFMWQIAEYMIRVHADLDSIQAKALFDDINHKLYEDWKQGDW